MRRLWPVSEAAQADYETLREAVLATGTLPTTETAARFSRRGLAGLIAWPVSEPVFSAVVLGADRPRWSGHADPRHEVLSSVFALVLSAPTERLGTREAL